MRKRLRAALVVSFALTIAASILVMPAGGTEVDVLRLQLNSSSDRFILDGQTQTLSQANCRLRSAGTSLVSVVGGNDGNTRNPSAGLKDHRIGVGQNGEGNGEPCARINRDLGQFLSLGLTGALTGRTIDYAEIDLGFKFNGDVQLVLFLEGTEVGTVVVPCSGASDCGPDSGASDNERVVLYQESEFPSGTFPSGHWQSFPITSDFDTIIIRPGSASSSGSVSLEAGFDGSPAGPLGVDLGTVDTLFRLSNTAPTANADPGQASYTTAEDTPLVVAAPGVLANDSDIDGDTLEAVVEVGPSNGAVTLNSNGGFTYTPDFNFHGPDSFTYRATDGTALSAPATVSITVTPVNDAPVATATSVAVDEDSSVIVPVGTDVDGDALTVTCSGDNNGTVADNGDGSITYAPMADSNVGDALSCSASDGDLSSDPATINVTVSPVNDGPVANDDSADTNANVAVAIDVVSNDTDIDGDTLSVASSTDGANGTTAINEGTVSYTPNLDFFGTDSFTYTVSDGNGASDTADVSVTVFEVMCSGDEVSDVDGDVSGSFTRLTDSEDCKRYVIDADAETGTVLFQPEGGDIVIYRGYVEFAGDNPPAAGDTTGFPLFLEYDPDPEGEDIFQPLPWCTHNVFDAEGNVESATIPAGDSWCIASAFTRGEGTELVTTWQVYGRDDPIIKAR